ncbi:hypothetical protein CC1G_01814 [Coprinopsis cinerea okayama7|uniref:Uncharacterized protein n=1 Tax=Coprinopsis cinerea (strain Okayama-7 / 130 / ATCC MYA-4618 / FGSC 9003) TaxID=240176 RepID=A8N2G1_COPC7|nr:hypothetical protein CC1G_01814 [Coprinopsis cinerea okayama7\|eukprot:XP_001829134.2 hypothetical protein CC1G_01814 [Coprinopsis cinerea okayama7\
MENTTPTTKESQDVFTEPVPTNVASTSGSRIHYPPSLEPSAGRLPRQYPDYLQKSYGNLAPPVRRSSPLNPQKGNQRRSVQGNGSPLNSPTLRHRRIPSPGIMDIGNVPPEVEQDAHLFANEYDLSHEDPRILLDVQRAIKLKARREARLKRQQQSPSLPSQNESPASVLSATSSTRSPSQSPWNPRNLATSSPPPSPTPPRKTSNSTTQSDLDFSPSTGGGLFQIPIYAHPVPTSLDNGRTLDWTGTGTEDDRDRKWHLGKRKEKDRILPLGVMAEQQEAMYQERLNKIKSHASQQTHKKASITKQQLSRRYKLLDDSQKSPDEYDHFNFLNVARWYGSVGDPVKRSMEKAEPFSWLRHLEGPSRKTERPPWHMTALIMEEYVQAQKPRHAPTMPPGSNFSAETIPDGSTGAVGDPSEALSPVHETLSFGPHHRSNVGSIDSRVRGTLDSTSSFRFPNPSASTSSSPFHPQPFPRPYLQSNPRSDASSNGSLSDYSESGVIRRPHISNSTNQSPRPPGTEVDISVVGRDERGESIPLELRVSTSSKGSDPSLKSKSPLSQSVGPSKKNPLPRRIWTSIPSNETVKRHANDDEARLRREYEVKLRILEESNRQNHRIRQMLNRISASVREYDAVQAASAKKPGIPHHPLPKELVEAFSHDPAAVTGHTRRLKGYKAVEDIHQRVTRQREVFRAFLANSPKPPSTTESILMGPAENLIDTLDVLETHRGNITAMAAEIAQSLQNVQALHCEVKEEYNLTVSRTSVLYPELSHIVALEESYRDRYQGFYDFGMDALTLLLDTVTPLWRSYGKTIGEDVRDFLIIPLYRNEFTGEAKRYPIQGLPQRSLRHWLGLIIFFFSSIAVNYLQLQSAVTSMLNYRLQWIPYDGVRWTALPLFWIAIIIQWIAVLIEMVIVLMQLGTIAWWIGWFVKIFK